MAIDRIGKGAGLPPTPEAAGTGAAGGARPSAGAEAPFTVDRAGAAGTAAGTERAGEVDATTPLARLKSGEVDVNGYVDLKVDQATKDLKGLAPHELEDIKSVLRDQMKTDPGLVDLVRSATGATPAPPSDEE